MIPVGFGSKSVSTHPLTILPVSVAPMQIHKAAFGDYNESIGGANDLDAFMNMAKSRALHTWDERYTAKLINAFIRAGYAQ
jgi:hypothetical protein